MTTRTYTIEESIRTAYATLARRPQHWVSLRALRTLLTDRAHEDIDAALVRMSEENPGRVHLTPENNRKVLTQADHDAAVYYGGDWNNLLVIQ